MSSSGGVGDRRSGNSKPFSLSSKSTSASSKKPAFNFQPSRGRPTNLPRRPHQLGHGDDSDEEEQAPAHETVSGFDTHTGGLLTADGQAVAEEGPLVIPVSSKNNWRDRPGTNVKKGKKNLLPKEVQAMQEAERNGQAVGGNVEVEGPSMAYGLSFAQKGEVPNGGEDQPMADAKPEPEHESMEEKKPLTDDQVALRALISESKGDVERRSDLVIEASNRQDEEDGRDNGRYDETSSFRTDVASRPEPATLDQYNAIPVEEFGAALLRGMGWKDGQAVGRGSYSSKEPKKATVPPRRAGFLGIGAKDSSGGKGAESEFGAWGKSAMRKASRKQGEENASGSNTEGVYMPVMMRNKTTGEYITEEELADMKKKAAAQPDKDEWRERRDRNLEKSGRDRDRDYRKRDYGDGRSDRRVGSSRRDRSRSSDRHSSRRSRYDNDDDRRRDDRRDRDRDRDRRRDRDDDKDYGSDRNRDRRHRDDRHSSSRHSSHSSRHDRYEQDRDSHRSRRDD